MKENYPCPCGGKLKWKKDEIIIDGVNCGLLDVEFCENCGEEYFPGEAMEIVETKLKKRVCGAFKEKK